MSMAGWVRVPAVRPTTGVQIGQAKALAVCRLPASGLADGRHDSSLYQNTALTVWFWAAYLMTTYKRGVSALLLQRQLGLSRYETAWMLLHKLRRAMVNLARGSPPEWSEAFS
jgi:hypothetical protein